MSFLMHHGILGMKWGIRRYQNPDGTLTSAGKARYGDVTKMSAKQLRKYDKSISPDSDAYKKLSAARQKYLDQAAKKANKTKEGTEYNALNQYLTQLDKTLKDTYGPNAQMVVGEQDAAYINKVYADYNKKVSEYLMQRSDEYYGVYLSTLGFNNTKEGRKYAAEILDNR